MMNTTGVVCPGCQAGDFAMPHICQPTAWQPQPLTPSWGNERLMCAHCWCLEEEAGWRWVGSKHIDAKAHQMCCTCGSRRLQAEEPRP